MINEDIVHALDDHAVEVEQVLYRDRVVGAAIGVVPRGGSGVDMQLRAGRF